MPEAVQHLSIRVPWHDRGWEGTVCHAPSRNDACLVLPRINADRIDPQEDSFHDRDWEDLPPEVELPPCVREKAGFMRASEFTVPIRHPYSSWSPAHQGLNRLPLRFPAWSAPCVPFRWMSRKSAEEIAADGLVDYEPELESEANVLIGHDTSWVQDGRNQRALLGTFFDRIVGGLCFFYARRVPHSDEDRKILIGVGRTLAVSEPEEFGGTNPLDTVAWECMVQHSIRAESGEGFLLPYHAALDLAEQDPSFDPASVLAYVPDEGWDEFAYGTEHVTNDTAISALVACERALREAERVLSGPRTQELQWVSEWLGELWRLRGPSPGIGAVLQAFGVLHGTLVVRRLLPYIAEKGDPWDIVEAALRDPASVPVDVSDAFTPSLCHKWTAIPEERRALLKLLSRFDLSAAQAERWYEPANAAALIENPYRLYEADRERPDPIAVTVVDHGAFPDPVIASQHPLPEPSRVTDNQDVRRGRALLIAQLERAGAQGHTLQSATAAARAVRDAELTPPCPLDADMIATYGERLEPLIRRVTLYDGAPALQLERFVKGGNVIRDFVMRRRGGKRHPGVTDWRRLLDTALDGAADPEDVDEQRARHEKTAALAELHESRFSVLVGPAGTGKTTLLRTLCDHPSVDNGNVLLLAPTGKARVRLSQALERESQTLAQFLLKIGRYDPDTGIYRRSNGPKESGYATVIVDEASMLTEDQLAAVIDGLAGVKRFILVGDYRQLPPIGAGRPFVDIVHWLEPERVDARFPRVGSSYAELTVPRRPTEIGGEVTSAAQRRVDLMLAEWFSGRAPSPGADVVWDLLRKGKVDDTLRVLRWEGPGDLHEQLLDVLVEELALDGPDDVTGFAIACGGSEFNGSIYFHRGRKPGEGAALEADAWQILAPVRGGAHGVRELNRALHLRFRKKAIEDAGKVWRRVPKPLGAEQIVYGDKVISVRNESWRKVFPAKADRYVANGDIGIVVGQFKGRKSNIQGNPWKTEVELTSQPGYAYEYRTSHFRDEGDPPLELAYALTIHKAQGSEFERTIVVIPEPCRLLSRELLYTALTRQSMRVTILYQGEPGGLLRYAAPELSETAGRLTNLFSAPDLVERPGGRYLERGLIHTTTRGDVVRSKSEAIICEVLFERGIDYAYERELRMDDGSRRLPDFTIEDADTGLTIYWEHLGMLGDHEYARRWEAKRRWYAEHDIYERSEAHPDGGPGGMLVWTADDEHGGIDIPAIKAFADELFD